MKIFKLLFIYLVWSNIAFAANVPGPLVETSWLAKNQNKVVILEIRKQARAS